MRSLKTTLIATAAVALSACSIMPVTNSHSSMDPMAPSSGMWPVPTTPSPLGVVSLFPGESRPVSLVRSTETPMIQATPVARFDGTGNVTIEVFPDHLVVQAPAEGGACGIVTTVLNVEGGYAEEISFPVIVEPMPMVTFSASWPGGKMPNHVYVAGEFNGWNGSKDEMVNDGSGNFTATLPVSPGTWKYKFVVDGDWVADPSNPEVG